MPVARRSDPWTSWAAAESLGDLRARQAAVAAVFDVMGELTLEELVSVYRQNQGYWPHPDGPRLGHALPAQSDSGIRTRCRELMDAGLVIDTGDTRPTAANRRARVLTLAPRQLALAVDA